HLLLLFFFTSIRRHTTFSRDWSSDVCSSDLVTIIEPSACLTRKDDAHEHDRPRQEQIPDHRRGDTDPDCPLRADRRHLAGGAGRSEERRVGSDCNRKMKLQSWIYKLIIIT